MTDAILGIDIAKAKFDVALWRDGKLRHKVLPNTTAGFTALSRWLAKQGVPRVHACLEATGTYGEALALYLTDAGHVVSRVNPARIQAYARSEGVRTKTDKVDAGVIARFAAAQRPGPWTPPAPELRALQALVRRLQALTDMHVQETNRLEGNPSRAVRDSIETHLAFLDAEIARTKAAIDDHIDRHPGLKADRDLLATIPGIGALTAAKFLAEVVDVRAYTSARAVAAFAGLTPRQRLSGSSVHGRSVLSKTGNARLRQALYLPAVVAARHNPDVRDLYQRLLAKGKSKMSALGAAMRKLVHICFGVLKHRQPYRPRVSMGVDG
jgi:transposase